MKTASTMSRDTSSSVSVAADPILCATTPAPGPPKLLVMAVGYPRANIAGIIRG